MPNWTPVEDEPWVDVDLSSPDLKPIDTAPRDETRFIGVDDLGNGWIVWSDERGFFDQDGEERKDLVQWLPM